MEITPSQSLIARAAAAIVLSVSLSLPAVAAPAHGPAPHAVPKTQPLAAAAVHVLPNGLRVLVVEDHLAPVAETAVYYNFGAYDEVSGKTGLAHALEHMMFRGTPSLSGDGLTDALSQLGATMNATTLADYTRFYFVVPAERLDLALHIEADRMQNLALNAADWQAERGAVLTEIIGKDGSTAGTLRRQMLEAAYGKDSRYALDVGGHPEDVRAATVADLRDYYSRWYAPNNATLVVTGDVRPAQVYAAAQRYFGSIPRKTLPPRNRPAPHLNLGARVSLHGDYAFGFLNVAYPFVGDVGGRETDAASLLPSIINNIRSPFYRALVVSGLAYGISASPDTTLHDGLLYVAMTPKPPHTPDDVLAVFQKTMQQFVADGPAPELLAAAKREVATQNTFARDSIPGLGYLQGYVVGYELHDDPNHDATEIGKVTLDDVRAAAKTYLATPAVIGSIVADGARTAPPAPPPPKQINDDFSARAAGNHIVAAPWVTSAVSGALTAANHAHPVEFALSNGLRIYVQTVSVNPTVYVSGSIRSSSKFDPPGKEGTGAIATALMSYGSARYDFVTRSRLQDEMSASIGIGQSFSAYGLSKDFSKLVDILADGIEHPAFPDEYFTLIKTGYASAIARSKHSPELLARRAVNEMLAPPGDPSLREATEKSIGAITKDDVIAYHRQYIRPDLARITVVGNVTVPQVRAALQAAFGSWTAEGPTPDLTLPPLPVPAGRVATIPSNGSTVSVTLAQVAPPRSSPDFYPLMVLNTILGYGGEMSTRLMQSLRVKRGLVYGVGSDYQAAAQRGTFQFYLSATPEHVRQAVTLLKAEIARAQSEPPTQAELARAKKYIIGETLVNEDSIGGIASAINNIGLNDLPLDYYQTRNAIFNAVTADDVLRVAKEYLKPKNMAEVYQGPAF